MPVGDHHPRAWPTSCSRASSAVGKTFYSWGDNPIRVVGVVDTWCARATRAATPAHEYSMILPIRCRYTSAATT